MATGFLFLGRCIILENEDANGEGEQCQESQGGMAAAFAVTAVSKLFITEGTVKNYLTNILGKLGVRDRTQAALKAKELELI